MLKRCHPDAFDPSFSHNLALRTATIDSQIEVISMLLQDKRVNPLLTAECPRSALVIAFEKDSDLVLQTFMYDWPSFRVNVSHNLRAALLFLIQPDDCIVGDLDITALTPQDFQVLFKRSFLNPSKRRAVLDWLLLRIGVKQEYDSHVNSIIASSDLVEMKRIYGRSVRAYYLYRIFKNLPKELIGKIISYGINDTDDIKFPARTHSRKNKTRSRGTLVIAGLLTCSLLLLLNPGFTLFALLAVAIFIFDSAAID